MNDHLQSLLAELEQFGRANDSATTERPRKMLNITRDTGEFLAVLVRATAARRVLEIGTSNGYSTLWLASAAQAIAGTVTTIEFSGYKIALATKNFVRSGLAAFITSIQDHAGRVLGRTADSAFDFIFLDSERPEYPGWWAKLRRVLRLGGLLVVDNATSHHQEMAPFVALVQADPSFTTSLMPVGNGEFMAVRALKKEMSMPTESNKTIVRRYFEEVVDKRKLDILGEIVATDCIIHRPEASEPIRGLEAFRRALERILRVYSDFTTTIHDLIAEDDRVACRLSHQAVNRGEWTSRLGTHAVAGKTVTWPAIAIFRIRDGKILEEWVNRDELGMLIGLGVLPSSNESK